MTGTESTQGTHRTQDTHGGPKERNAPRFWSVRRVPAALIAAIAAAGLGLVLYDVVAVRAEKRAMPWRPRLADELAARHLDDAWMLVGAGVALLLGIWLVLLAVTPGLRRLLPMRRASDDLRAGLDRHAAAVVLRDRAMQVSGVQSVRVAVRRRKVSARADSHFRDLDDVRADLGAVLGDGIEELGLARSPGLTVQVRRPAAKG